MNVLEDPRKLRLVDWLTTPPDKRNPRTRRELADELLISVSTLWTWQKDPLVIAHWDRESKLRIGSPERTSLVLDDVFKLARDPDLAPMSRLRAADLYLKAVDAMRPPEIDKAIKTAAELSDAELQALLAEAAQAELVRRSGS